MYYHDFFVLIDSIDPGGETTSASYIPDKDETRAPGFSGHGDVNDHENTKPLNYWHVTKKHEQDKDGQFN